MTIDTGHPDSGIVEIEIPSRVDFVAVVRMIVAAATNAVEALQGERLDDLRWVTSEATTNAIEANLAAVPEGRVAIQCQVDPGRVSLSVSDEGSRYADVASGPRYDGPGPIEH